MPRTGRHIAQRERPRARSLLLPALLLVTSGGAFGGLALLPAAPEAVAMVPAGSAPGASGAPPGRTGSASGGSGAAPSRGSTREDVATRGISRASRDRRPAQGSRAGEGRTAPPASAIPSPPAPVQVVRPQFARPGVGPLTSRFGQRWGRLHAGIDLAAGTSAPVSAAADGVVLSAGTESGYGTVVRVQHAEDTVTVYAHLSALLVEAGLPVSAGTVLGREGNSGHSTGPHLHFEVRIAGVPVDPVPWLQARGVDP